MVNGIERHVTFHGLPEEVEEFEKFIEEKYRPVMANTNGFIKSNLLNDTENHQDLKMVLRFESKEAAARWRTSASHAALKPRLNSLYNGSELKVYEVMA